MAAGLGKRIRRRGGEVGTLARTAAPHVRPPAHPPSRSQKERSSARVSGGGRGRSRQQGDPPHPAPPSKSSNTPTPVDAPSRLRRRSSSCPCCCCPCGACCCGTCCDASGDPPALAPAPAGAPLPLPCGPGSVAPPPPPRSALPASREDAVLSALCTRRGGVSQWTRQQTHPTREGRLCTRADREAQDRPCCSAARSHAAPAGPRHTKPLPVFTCVSC